MVGLVGGVGVCFVLIQSDCYCYFLCQWYGWLLLESLVLKI